MNRSVSIYLDLVRLSAALLVMLYHFAYARFSGGGYQFFRDSHIGSDAVILFFVLSGYVIAYVAQQRDRNLSEYSINRLSRLWSVVIPALILTLVVDQTGRWINPSAYEGWWYQDSSPVVRIVFNLFFINEVWFYSIRPFTNGPFWSLGYEFWYYVIFAAAFYFKGYWRIGLLSAAMLIAGPKILLLLPVWLMGVWAFHFNQRSKLSIKVGWLFFLSPFLLYFLIKSTGFDQMVFAFSKIIFGDNFVDSTLGFSDEFLISYLYGVLIVLNFLGLNTIAPAVEKILVSVEKPIRYWAGLTFSIYLFHYPLFQFFSAVYGLDVSDPLRHLLILSSALFVIVIVGNRTEKKKYRVKNQLKKLSALVNR